jgi:hypothetical protein
MSKNQTELNSNLEKTKLKMLKIWQKCLRDYKNQSQKLTQEQALDYIDQFEKLWYKEVSPLLKKGDSDFSKKVNLLDKNIKILIGDCEQYLTPVNFEELFKIKQKLNIMWEESLKKRNPKTDLLDKNIAIQISLELDQIQRNYLDRAFHTSKDENILDLVKQIDSKLNYFNTFLNDDIVTV